MPLRDTYRWGERFDVPIGSVWLMWATSLLGRANHFVLDERYIAHVNIHGATDPETMIDTESYAVSDTHPVARRWLTFDAYSPPECEVQIKDCEAGYRLVGVVELVLPSTKAEPTERTRFLAKCVSHVIAGVGVAVVDAVPDGSRTLHNELMTLFGAPPAAHQPDDARYAAVYRMATVDSHPMVSACWLPLTVGQPLPAIPLPLKDGPEIMIDLESTYMQALDGLNL